MIENWEGGLTRCEGRAREVSQPEVYVSVSRCFTLYINDTPSAGLAPTAVTTPPRRAAVDGSNFLTQQLSCVPPRLAVRYPAIFAGHGVGAARVGVVGHWRQARRSVRYCCSPLPSLTPPHRPPLHPLLRCHTHTLGLSTPGRARSDQFTTAAIWWKTGGKEWGVGWGGGQR